MSSRLLSASRRLPADRRCRFPGHLLLAPGCCFEALQERRLVSHGPDVFMSPVRPWLGEMCVYGGAVWASQL